MTYSLTWLPQVLRDAGLKVVEQPGWQTRGHGDAGRTRGVVCHHTNGSRTGNMPTLPVLINGRPDLSGPLAQLGLGRDGTYYVIAAGLCYHAGAGSWQGITTGNTNFIGIEAENVGDKTDPWPAVQMDAYRRGVAAILTKIGVSPIMCCGHKEYAPHRKDDPSFDMVVFRKQVAEIMAGGQVAPQPQPAPSPAISTGRGSWYSQYVGRYKWEDKQDKPNSNALGVPDYAQGISFPEHATLGHWFEVTAPNGIKSIEQQTEIGPAAWTGRKIDVSAVAAERRFKYTPKNFPTNGTFTWYQIAPPAAVAGLSPREQAVKYYGLRSQVSDHAKQAVGPSAIGVLIAAILGGIGAHWALALAIGIGIAVIGYLIIRGSREA